jgi:ABC-type transport system substrate-binding protein
VLYDPSPLEAAGVKVNAYWNAPFAAGYGSYWLDPKGAEFGPAAAYMKFHQAEATKMLQAAGYDASKPLTFDLVYAGTQYGTDYPTRVETWQSMLAKMGVKVNLTSVDYATDYVPKYFRAKAEFKGKTAEGAVQYPPGGTAPDPILFYFKYISQGGASSMTGKYFPEIDEKLRKLREITDFDARLAGVKDLQRYTIDNMAVIPTGPATDTVDLVWTALRGPQQYQAWLSSANGTSSTTIMFPNYWFQSEI